MFYTEAPKLRCHHKYIYDLPQQRLQHIIKPNIQQKMPLQLTLSK